jgi:hypothetical protein
MRDDIAIGEDAAFLDGAAIHIGAGQAAAVGDEMAAVGVGVDPGCRSARRWSRWR